MPKDWGNPGSPVLHRARAPSVTVPSKDWDRARAPEPAKEKNGLRRILAAAISGLLASRAEHLIRRAVQYSRWAKWWSDRA
jgi:hypothetical protein